MTDFDPALVDKAARALHAERCCPCDPNGCGAPDPQDYSAARVVLAAVAEWMNDCDAEALRRNAMHDRLVQEARAEGARAEAALWQAQVRGHDRSGVMALDREAAYHRGMAEGAQQVRAAVDAEIESAYRVGANYVPCIRLENAAREAVAHIEKGDE